LIRTVVVKKEKKKRKSKVNSTFHPSIHPPLKKQYTDEFFQVVEELFLETKEVQL
jgi:hypothetical protein